MCDNKTKAWVAKARSKHGDRFDYSESVYTGVNNTIDIICPKHGKFTTRARKHLDGVAGCRACLTEPKFTTDEWIAKAQSTHGDKYDYSKSLYLGTSKPITVICPDHGEFTIMAGKHIAGQGGCKSCKSEKLRNIRSKPLDQWIKDAVAVHGDIYDYSKVSYEKVTDKVEIICHRHGSFFQNGSSHTLGAGCPECHREQMTGPQIDTNIWELRAKDVHGDVYEYNDTQWGLSRDKITINCPRHGAFSITLENHIYGQQGCPQCGRGRLISKGCNEWLDSLGVSIQNREVSGLLGNYVVDGYDPETKTVYEFHGDYWHGNPDLYESDDINPTTGVTYGELYQRTYDKREQFRKAGFSVIEMWEADWNTTKRSRKFPVL